MLFVHVCSGSDIRMGGDMGGPGIGEDSEEFVLDFPGVSARWCCSGNREEGTDRSKGRLKEDGGRLGV